MLRVLPPLLLLLVLTTAYTTTTIMSSSSSSAQEMNKESNCDLQSDCPSTTTASPRDESSDVLQRWSQRWESNDTPGWHQKDVHSMLLQYFPKVASTIPKTKTIISSDGEKQQQHSLRVLVPLCGKSVDLVYLAKHESVSKAVGVDGIQKAIDAFIIENPELYKDYIVNDGSGNAGVPAQPCGKQNQFAKYEGENISMLKGDFFDLDKESISEKLDADADDKRDQNSLFDVVWDRASLVAIKPEKREEYADVLSKMINPGGTIILCALDRRYGTEEAKAYGPPFSLPEEEIRRLFESQDWVQSVEKMEEHDESITDPKAFQRWKDMGLTSLFEMLFIIQTKDAGELVNKV